MDIQLKKGLLDVSVLKCLSLADSYGYKIISDISLFIEITESTLYPILKRLEEQKCLTTYKEEHNGRIRKYYSITKQGKNKLKQFKKEFLDKLKNELQIISYNDIDNLIDYYDELIEDENEKNKDENEIISNLNIPNIIKDINIEEKLELAKNKPTISNIFKAIIAVCSLPILMPLAIAFILIILSLLLVIGSFIIAFGSIIIALIATFGAVITTFPIGISLIYLGITLLIIITSILMIKLLINLTKKIFIASINKLNKKNLERNNKYE